MEKIFVFNTLYYPNKKGGAESSVQLVCEELVKQGVDVNVVSVWDKSSPLHEVVNGVQSFKWKPYNVYSVHDYSAIETSSISKIIWQIIDLFNFVMFFKALFLFIKQKPDIVWTNNLSGFSVSIWVAAFLLNVPVCHTARDYYLLSNNVQLYKDDKLIPGHNIISKIKVAIFRFLSSRLSAFVGISDFVVSYHSKYSRVKTKRRIYNSVSLEYNDRVLYEKDKNKARVYGYLGQINKAKGIDTLTRNFISNSKSSLLNIAGNDVEGYAKKITDSRINFVGFRSPIEFFTEIDCLIVPSEWDEPFGRIVVESLANMTPVICSNQGGLSELSQMFKSVTLCDFKDEINYDSFKVDFSMNDLSTLYSKFSNESIASQYKKLFMETIA
ncbi:glycosyltransferase [Vibrio sp. 1569]|uniref:glycosyltransferase n=1 Tax=Vibrio sp. 1569 TaxID=3074565 RepID=UPI0029654F26|nr:glycosyltransferase [Vibrio sp. 1569]MDW2252108.1 glycosyltransferase [Vibrio sp. 1569]